MKITKILAIFLIFALIMSISFANTNKNNSMDTNRNSNSDNGQKDTNSLDRNTNKDNNNSDQNRNIVSQTVRNINQIRKQYQEMFVNAVHDNNNELKEEMRQLRHEVTNMVQTKLSNNEDINFDEFKEFGTRIEMKSNEIIVDDDSNRIQSKNKIMTKLKNKDIEINNHNNKVQIKEGNITVDIDDSVTIDENGIYISNKKLEVLPSKIQEKLQDTNNFQLRKYPEGLMYQFEFKNKRALFGFIPMESMEQVLLNAENGKIENHNPPWWAFLATSENNLTVGQEIN